MLGLWGTGQLTLTKSIIVVDHDVNIHDMNEVLWVVTTRTDPARDIMILDRMPTDTLDPASPFLNFGSKVGIDATAKSKDEGFEREWQEVVEVDAETRDLVSKKWLAYGVRAASM